MKVLLIFVGLFVSCTLLGQRGFWGGGYSIGLFDNSPIKTTSSPLSNSSILKTGQHTLTGSKSRVFRNRKYFGYNLSLSARFERYKTDLRYEDLKISNQDEYFNKLSFRIDWGLQWQFPIFHSKLYLLPGFNIGFMAYRNPVERRIETDNFNNNTGDFYYYVELINRRHLQLYADVRLGLLYEINEEIGIQAFAHWNTGERIDYYAYVFPADDIPSEVNEFENFKDDSNRMFTNINNLDIGIAICFKLKNDED